jgi:hypothetical protein
MVHLSFSIDHGLSNCYLHDPCFYHEHETLYQGKKKKSDLVFITSITRQGEEATSGIFDLGDDLFLLFTILCSFTLPGIFELLS